MELFFSPYVLRKKEKSGVQEGVLVRISDGGYWGVADISPHPHLGDKSWKEEIKSEGMLFSRALSLATEDLQARKQNLSLLSDKKIQNNFLIDDIDNTDLNQPRFQGRTLKIKGSHQIQDIAEKLNDLKLDIKIRLDFNSQLSEREYNEFLASLSADAKEKIEYVEDPTMLSASWKDWNRIIPLASDWQKTNDKEMAAVKICKPARENLPPSNQNVTLTSSMDHPVGVAHGMRLAQSFASNVCGFSTLSMYDIGLFEKYFSEDLPWLNFSEAALNDCGIGMTETLDQLKWLSLAEATL